MVAIVDPRRALLALLNAPTAEQFIEAYGPLREPIASKKAGTSNLHSAFLGKPHTPQETVTSLASLFSGAVSLSQDAKDRLLLNTLLAIIFNDPVTVNGTVQPTALDVDIVLGTVEPRPRDLLDGMALELLRSRKMIARCGQCSKFFYRQFSKDKYCSTVCTSEARLRYQAEWVQKKRESKKKGRKAH